jgi:hypothetical protein
MQAHLSRARSTFGTRRLRRMGAVAALIAAASFAVTGSNTLAANAEIASQSPIDPVISATATPAILAPPDAIVGESDGLVNFVVRLAEEGTNTVSVNFTTFNAGAGAGNSCNGDYKSTSGTLTFTPGEMSKLVPVEINDCADVEGFEAFTLGLSMAVNGTIWRASSRISIVDNDNIVATPRLFVRDAVVDEQDGTAFVSVLMGGSGGQASNSTVTVDYATANGTATSGSDYENKSGSFSFAPGETVKTVEIKTLDEVDPEGAESFTLGLSNPDNATLADGSGAVRIGASDAANSPNPSISAPVDLIAGEGDGYVDLAVSLSAPSSNLVTVDYADFNASAGAGNSCNGDFSAVTGELNFAPGETTKVVRVQVMDCADSELFEAFTFGLDTAVNGAIARASGRISIVDNDNVVAIPRVFVRDAVVDEKDGFAYVSVLLGGTGGQSSNSTVSVDYATANGTAGSGSDYTANSGTLSFAPGETAKTVVVPIADDGATEPTENFALTLSNPALATIADGSGTVWIGGSDGIASAQPSILAPADVIVGEGDGFADLVVSLSQPGQNQVKVDYADFNASAGAGNSCNGDFGAVNDSLTFAPGETTKVVRVQIMDCVDSELFEAFTFGLNTPVNAAIARASSRISIVDNDNVVATPRVFVRDVVVDETDGTAWASVLLGGTGGQSSNSTVTVDYTTADGTATAGSDYTAGSGTLSFAPGETAKTVPLAITDDATNESRESFTLTLSNPTLATIADGSGTVWIGASDGIATAQPSLLAPADVIVGEEDGFVDLVVRLSQPGQNQVTVGYADFNSTAGAGNSCNGDFGAVNDSLTFAPGETTKVVRVQIMDCADVERFESFTFGLDTPVNAAIGRVGSRISIVDNDTVVATPKLTVRDAVVDEKDGFALVSVLLGGTGSESSNSTVTVDYATISGSATEDDDYTPAVGTLAFAPGETAKTIVVPIADDGTTEGPESFDLDLNGTAGATILDGIGVVTIGASDAGATALPGIFAPADVAVSEGSGFVDLVVSLGAPGQNPVAVSYVTTNNTAGAGNSCNGDYSTVSGTLHFALGETTKVVRVEILDCANVESAETFHFTISTPVNGAISRATGVITIGDNDGAVTLSSIAVTPANPSIQVGADQQFTATGTFSDAHTENLTGTATWGSATTGVATISAGGLAHGVSAGSSTISAVQSGITGSTVVTVTQSQQAQAQTIDFAPLASKAYGDPDFTVAASASSGLPVSFTASGNCTISGQTVHITGAGSCTITASQSGNASYSPAPSIARTFTIGKASQTITFAPLGNKRLGNPDFNVSATASSGLAVSFTGGGRCTISGARVHLTAAGICTITASQAGNANFSAAPAVARSFTIGPRAVPVRCRVPNVVGKTLARAKALLSQRRCRTGKVMRAYSRTRRKGVVIGQSRRPGRVLPAGSRVNLVVSRGRRRG